MCTYAGPILSLLLGVAGGAAAEPRPFIYGCGITWGRWLGLKGEAAKRFDRLSMDRIKEMGGTCVPANFAWHDIEPKPGVFNWDYVDHQVAEARRRGLEVFAYTGLTPDWALPPSAPKKPGIGYRFPPDERFAAQFDAFFTALARRYAGKVTYYEFWNEPNGCSWIKDGCANATMAHTYVPWLRRWYRAMKEGDPTCVLAVGGLDYYAGVKHGYRYLEDVYAAGGGDCFDAVAIHPYGKPLHWQAIHDTYAVLVKHGHGHKKLWLNEYGWNTRDEEKKAAHLRTVLTELAKPKYHMVFQASYLVLTDLPETDDGAGHDFGLCARDRHKGTITPRASYTAFKKLPKRRARPAAATPRRGTVPDGFLLWFAAPGCDPGQDCDDVGPPRKVRERIMATTGANVGTFRIAWGSTERSDPSNGPSRYDFSKVRPSDYAMKQKHLICSLDFLHNGWARKFRFTDRARYNRLLERWAEAACRFARETYGVGLFETGGNERDLVAPETYRPHFPDWHYYYMDPIKAVHAGMKRAHPENRLIIGNLCYSDREHISALYDAGAKGNFEVLAIHAYGKNGVHVDMEQVIESHQEMASRGDPHIPVLVTEGWSCFPLPPSIDKDPQFRRGPRPYTPREVEHYRQTVLDGWRNLMTPRPGEYNPAWVLGARYFVLNDHWGGRNWAKRARPKHDAAGKLLGFQLDGYWIATSDPDYVKPFLRPWGLIDIHGKPKGDVIHAFPPYTPKHRLVATLEARLPRVPYHPTRRGWTADEVIADRPYTVRVGLVDLETTTLTDLSFSLGEKVASPEGYAFAFINGRLRRTEIPANRHLVTAKLIGPGPPDRIRPGEAIELRYEVRFDGKLDRRTDRGWRCRVRPYVDLYFVWEGRVYHSDAWLPRVVVRKQG